ncbi:hypothetical protein BAY61_24815 [Prauserella marina]|uniref:hypothetical protein n=1 Tax=Prauserella marina TaxID=530584 RepID=UPI000B81AA43|nr:hypothetical protein [Prauserella marina]ASR37691.1 hypothetical protein BAY61_24815 [Prauserella marina]
MGELVYYIVVSIDGQITAPDGGFDTFLMEGDPAPVLKTADRRDRPPVLKRNPVAFGSGMPLFGHGPRPVRTRAQRSMPDDSRPARTTTAVHRVVRKNLEADVEKATCRTTR